MVKMLKAPPRKVLGVKPVLARPGLAKPAKALGPTGGVKKATAKPGGAFAQAAAEEKAAELRRSVPWSVSCPVGGSLEVYLLDKGEPFTCYRHSVGGGPSTRSKEYPCIKDSNEACPICNKEGKEGAFVMYLTCVVPKDTYKTKDGETVTRRFQKKLFPIKIKMAKKYQRIYEQYGTFRGLHLKLHRDNKMDAAIGSDVEVIRVIPEAQLRKYALAADIKGEAGDMIRKAKIDEPVDYEKAFPRLSAKDLAAMFGRGATAGVGGLGNEDFEEGGDDGDFGTASADEW